MKNKTLVYVDLDNTLADARLAFAELGPEPEYEKDPKAFELWLEQMIQKDRLLAFPVVKPIASLVDALVLQTNTEVCYLTGRKEALREITVKWLTKHNLPDFPLYMREGSDYENAGVFKTKFIKDKLITSPKANVIVLDDDPSGVLSIECKKNGWLLGKVDLDKMEINLE